MRSEIKQLKDESTVKEDLQVLYEAIQEVGYTEYSLLKLMERLSGYIDEIRRITQDPRGGIPSSLMYDTQELVSRTRSVEKDVDSLSSDVKTRLDGVVEQIDEVLREVRESITESQEKGLSAHIPLLTQASKQILIQSGFDPETGTRNVQMEIDKDWKKFKSRLADFLWSAFFAGVSVLVMWFYSEHQKRQTEAAAQQVQTAVQKLIETAENNQKKH